MNDVLADSGASISFEMDVGALRKNGYVILNNRPCKIVDITPTKKTTDHVKIIALDIFTGKKYESTLSTQAKIQVPHIRRTEYTVFSIDDEDLTLMDEDAAIKEDIKLPEGENLKAQLLDLFNNKDTSEVLVTVVTAYGEAHVVSCRESLN